MEHNEAIHLMAAEKYLLGELSPETRDAFEEHFFDCAECAFDVRMGMELIDDAKVVLPGLPGSMAALPDAAPRPAAEGRSTRKEKEKRGWWQGLFASPAFAAPAFATLLLVIGYQNLVTYPALRLASSTPRLLPAVALHGGTRGGASTVVEADRNSGVLLQLDKPEGPEFTSYVVDLYNPQGKLAWTVKTSATGDVHGDTLSLVIPAAALKQGTYALALVGLTASGQRNEIQRQLFEIRFHD